MQQFIVQCFSFLVPLLDSTSEDAEDRLFFKSFTKNVRDFCQSCLTTRVPHVQRGDEAELRPGENKDFFHANLLRIW